MSNPEYINININDQSVRVIFWQPANSIGQAATADLTYDDQPVKVNLHWPAPGHALDPKTNEQLLEQIKESLEKHPLTALNGKNVFYLLRSDDHFVSIPDPGWVPAMRR